MKRISDIFRIFGGRPDASQVAADRDAAARAMISAADAIVTRQSTGGVAQAGGNTVATSNNTLSASAAADEADAARAREAQRRADEQAKEAQSKAKYAECVDFIDQLCGILTEKPYYRFGSSGMMTIYFPNGSEDTAAVHVHPDKSGKGFAEVSGPYHSHEYSRKTPPAHKCDSIEETLGRLSYIAAKREPSKATAINTAMDALIAKMNNGTGGVAPSISATQAADEAQAAADKRAAEKAAEQAMFARNAAHLKPCTDFIDGLKGILTTGASHSMYWRGNISVTFGNGGLRGGYERRTEIKPDFSAGGFASIEELHHDGFRGGYENPPELFACKTVEEALGRLSYYAGKVEPDKAAQIDALREKILDDLAGGGGAPAAPVVDTPAPAAVEVKGHTVEAAKPATIKALDVGAFKPTGRR